MNRSRRWLEIELRAPTNTLSSPGDEQVQRYQSLFQKLIREPEQGLPFNFASKVTGQLKIKLKRRSDIRFNLLALFAIVVGLLSVFGLLTVVYLTAGSQFLMSMLKFKWLLILGTVVQIGHFDV
jgi:hypothetical protein